MKRFLIIIGLLLVTISLSSCKKVENKEITKEFKVNNGYYIMDAASTVKYISFNTTTADIYYPNLYNKKFYVNFDFIYQYQAKSIDDVPNVCRKGVELQYRLTVNGEFIGSTVDNSAKYTPVEFKKVDGEKYLFEIRDTLNFYLNVPYSGVYEIEYLACYYIDDKMICSPINLTFNFFD